MRKKEKKRKVSGEERRGREKKRWRVKEGN